MCSRLDLQEYDGSKSDRKWKAFLETNDFT